MAPPPAHLLSHLLTYLPTHSSAHCTSLKFKKICQTQRKRLWQEGKKSTGLLTLALASSGPPFLWWRSPHSPALHSPLVTEQLRHWRRLQPCGGGMHTATLLFSPTSRQKKIREMRCQYITYPACTQPPFHRSDPFSQTENQGIAMSDKIQKIPRLQN